MKILIKDSLTSRPMIIEHASQVVVLNDFDHPVVVAYEHVDKDTVVAAHAGERDFEQHCARIGKLASAGRAPHVVKL